MTENMTDYDCAAHVAMVAMKSRFPPSLVTGAEHCAAHAAVEYDTHMAWDGYAKPTPEDRTLIRAASERLNKNANGKG